MLSPYPVLAFVAGFFLDFADWVVDSGRKAYYSTAHVLAFLSAVAGGLLLAFAPNAVLAIVVANVLARKVDHPIYLGSLLAFAFTALFVSIAPINPLAFGLFLLFAFLDEALPFPFVKAYRPFLKGAAVALLCPFTADALVLLSFDAGYHLNGWMLGKLVAQKGVRKA